MNRLILIQIIAIALGSTGCDRNVHFSSNLFSTSEKLDPGIGSEDDPNQVGVIQIRSYAADDASDMKVLEKFEQTFPVYLVENRGSIFYSEVPRKSDLRIPQGQIIRNDLSKSNSPQALGITGYWPVPSKNQNLLLVGNSSGIHILDFNGNDIDWVPSEAIVKSGTLPSLATIGASLGYGGRTYGWLEFTDEADVTRIGLIYSCKGFGSICSLVIESDKTTGARLKRYNQILYANSDVKYFGDMLAQVFEDNLTDPATLGPRFSILNLGALNGIYADRDYLLGKSNLMVATEVVYETGVFRVIHQSKVVPKLLWSSSSGVFNGKVTFDHLENSNGTYTMNFSYMPKRTTFAAPYPVEALTVRNSVVFKPPLPGPTGYPTEFNILWTSWTPNDLGAQAFLARVGILETRLMNPLPISAPMTLVDLGRKLEVGIISDALGLVNPLSDFHWKPNFIIDEKLAPLHSGGLVVFGSTPETATDRSRYRIITSIVVK